MAETAILRRRALVGLTNCTIWILSERGRVQRPRGEKSGVQRPSTDVASATLSKKQRKALPSAQIPRVL